MMLYGYVQCIQIKVISEIERDQKAKYYYTMILF